MLVGILCVCFASGVRILCVSAIVWNGNEKFGLVCLPFWQMRVFIQVLLIPFSRVRAPSVTHSRRALFSNGFLGLETKAVAGLGASRRCN